MSTTCWLKKCESPVSLISVTSAMLRFYSKLPFASHTWSYMRRICLLDVRYLRVTKNSGSWQRLKSVCSGLVILEQSMPMLRLPWSDIMARLAQYYKAGQVTETLVQKVRFWVQLYLYRKNYIDIKTILLLHCVCYVRTIGATAFCVKMYFICHLQHDPQRFRFAFAPGCVRVWYSAARARFCILETNMHYQVKNTGGLFFTSFSKRPTSDCWPCGAWKRADGEHFLHFQELWCALLK